MLEKFFQSVDITSVLIVAVFFLLLEYRPPWWYRKQKPFSSKGIGVIPGPLSLPVIGTSWVFSVGGYGLNQLHRYYDDLRRKYGSVVKEGAFGNIPVVSVFEKTDIEKVLKSGSKYPLRPPTEALALYRRSRPDRYASIGLVNEQGESWLFLRTALTPILTSPRTVSTFLPQINEIADDWCNLLKQSCDSTGKIVNVEQLADRLALEVSCAFVLGRRMGFLLPDEESDVARKLAEAVRVHFLATRDTYFGLPLWKYFPTPTYNKLVQSEETIYELVTDLILTADDSTRESPVFQFVLNANIDEREKTAAIVDFIAAGIHTLKNSFLFLLHSVGEKPEVQEKILKDPSRTYLKACLTESFRLYPTANALARIIEEEMELGGYNLKPMTVVVCHTGIACRDERNFKNPDEFRPERWLGEEKSTSTSSALFLLTPFGVGRRLCPGKRFIEQILPVFLEHTVRRFEISTVSELEVQFEFLLAPKGPVSIVIKDRM